MSKYLKVWWLFAINSFQTQLVARWAVILFLFGKLLRFAIFTIFIVTLLKKTNALAGYSLDQTLFFFLTFNLVDSLAQTIFREVYRFRPVVIEGTFDFYLIKPFNPLFRSLAAGPDLIDLGLMLPLIGAIIFFMDRLHISDPVNIFFYILLCLGGFVIALSFHILVLSLAVTTTEIDHAILVYRDITGMGRFPIDIYKEPLGGLLTFAIPVGLMMSFPVKSLFGLLSPGFIIYAILFSLTFLYVSIKVWNYSLKQYTSASS